MSDSFFAPPRNTIQTQSTHIFIMGMKKIMKINLSVSKKLLLGFGLILLIVSGISINSVFSVYSTASIQDRVTKLRVPTVQAGMLLEDGINQSLAGLRGYMILGKNPKKAEIFKNARLKGWKKIDGSMDNFREFAKNWTVPANIEHLKNMEGLVKEFRQAQQEIETIAHNNENIEAYNLLLTEAAPHAGKILKNISAMIDEESRLEASPQRKKLLKLLADSRGSFAVGLANIRAYLLSGDTKFRDNFHARWKVNITRFRQIKDMTSLFSSSQKTAWNNYEKYRTEFSPLPDKMFALRSAPDWNKANYWLGTKAAPKAKAIKDILHAMRVSQDKLMAADTKLLDSETNTMITVMILGVLISIFIGIGIAYYMARMISVPLQNMVVRANAIANGDLTTADYESSSNDELAQLGKAINSMNEKLHNVIAKVSNSTAQLATAAEELSSVATDSEKDIDSQSSEIDQVATAMNQMTATVQEVASNAASAADAAKSADNEARSGREVVLNSSRAIEELASNVESTSNVIHKLEEDSDNIGSVLDVIKGIAEQTNLLALNAAIEAARAGEQGRGFAVVADEVRTLASRTQKSTNEIQSMIENLQTGSRNAVAVMETGREKAQAGVDYTKEAAESLEAITRAVTTISEMNTMIATAAEEQSSVANEMNESIVKISQLGQRTSSGATQTSTSSHEMAKLATDLQLLVGNFKV